MKLLLAALFAVYALASSVQAAQPCCPEVMPCCEDMPCCQE